MSSKRCSACGVVKPLDEFPGDKKCRDGYRGQCCACRRVLMRAWRLAKLATRREYDRRRYHESPERREGQRISSLKSKQRYPDKTRARNAVSNAIRDGRLERQACEVCGAPRAQAHHDDYSRPLDVRWLCRDHHEQYHHAAA